MKHIAFQIGNVHDPVININGVAYDCNVSQLVDNPENGFYFIVNDNGQTDLAIEVADTEPDWTAQFAEYGTTSIYTTVSNDFIGGRPPTRCPKCLPNS